MSDKRNKRARRIVRVVNKVLDDFEKDPNIIFSGRAEAMDLRYKARIRRLRSWQSSRQCIFKGCNKRSIRRSHTIQKHGSLSTISESGYLLTPTFDFKTGRLSLLPTGLNDASTFPGFCREHELLFQHFENKSDLLEPQHFQLQIFRTICREIVVKQSLISYLEQMQKEYLEFRHKKLVQLVNQRIDSAFKKKPDFSIQSITSAGYDYRERMLNSKLEKLQTDLHKFEIDFYNAICEDMKFGDDRELFAQGFRLDLQVPVSLAGRGNFVCKDSTGEIHYVDVILNILPFDNWTYVLAVTPQRNKKFLEAYFSQFMIHPLVIFAMVETWMIHGSDHWFLRPSILQLINPKIQAAIIESLESMDNNIGEVCKYSIFNELRREFLSKISLEQMELLHGSFKDFVLSEQQKLEISLVANAS